MIRSERQLSVSRNKRDAALAGAETSLEDREVYEDLANEVQREIDEYIGVRDGYVNVFPIQSLDEIADALTKARIARGWSQRDLAERLGVSEQMVQRDEARGYEKAGLARLAEVADVLGYDLYGELRPVDTPVSGWSGGSYGISTRNTIGHFVWQPHGTESSIRDFAPPCSDLGATMILGSWLSAPVMLGTTRWFGGHIGARPSFGLGEDSSTSVVLKDVLKGGGD